ncbi:hypothetical protein A7982_12471 [Minicystis rosea]|nr:hypothetical protein A7982_12471 [Minicystis rosea]
MSSRPSAGIAHDDEPVRDFVRVLQDAIDTASAARFNERFAEDVLWGSPFGAVVAGYEAIHAIHEKMFDGLAGSPGASRYTIEHVRFLSEDVALAYVRRTRVERSAADVTPGKAGGFDELALFVLARRDGRWWLAAGQHVPDRRDVYASR